MNRQEKRSIFVPGLLEEREMGGLRSLSRSRSSTLTAAEQGSTQ